MLPKPPGEVTEQVIQEACREHWPESQTLDFKRELPSQDSRGRNEFLKDVCAMANADGGDLVYGVSEADGAASEIAAIHGQSADEIQRRLIQIVDAGLEPRVNGLTMKDVPLASGGFALVIRVPPSFEAPHRYRMEGNTRFVVRNGTVNSDMSYDQIRTAFDRTATLAERARQFRQTRCEDLADNRGWRPVKHGPIAVVHLMPLASFTGRTSVDVGSLHDGNYMEFAQTRPGWGSSTSRTLNIDGLAVHPGTASGAEVIAYSQVFRTGCLEAVRTIGHARMGEDTIPSTVLAAFVRQMTIAFASGAVHHGFLGPAVLGVSLLRVADVKLGLGERYARYVAPTSDRQTLLVPETWITALGGFNDVDAVVRPILDILWQCFDEPRCLEYDAQGRWKNSTVL